MAKDFGLVLFDFDGTLADTLPLIYFIFRRLFQEHEGRILSDSDIFSLFGPTEIGMIQRVMKVGDPEAVVRQMLQLYDANHDRLVIPHPGVIPMLEKLRLSGYPMALYSGKSRLTLDISLSKLRLGSWFDFTISGDDVMRTKPHPEGVLMAAKRVKTLPSKTLFIGDSDYDFMSAEGAGALFAGAHWLPGGSNFKQKKPERVFYDPLELSDWISLS